MVQRLDRLFKAKILDQLAEVNGAAAMGVTRETMELAGGGVAETGGVVLWLVNRAGAVILAAGAGFEALQVDSQRGSERGERERADVLVLVHVLFLLIHSPLAKSRRTGYKGL